MEKWLFSGLEQFLYFIVGGGTLFVLRLIWKNYDEARKTKNVNERILEIVDRQDKTLSHLDKLIQETNKLTTENNLRIIELERTTVLLQAQLIESYKRHEFFEMLKRIELMMKKENADSLVAQAIGIEIELENQRNYYSKG